MGAGHPACAGSDSSCLQAKYGPRLATHALDQTVVALTDTSHMNTSVYLFFLNISMQHMNLYFVLQPHWKDVLCLNNAEI